MKIIIITQQTEQMRSIAETSTTHKHKNLPSNKDQI